MSKTVEFYFNKGLTEKAQNILQVEEKNLLVFNRMTILH